MSKDIWHWSQYNAKPLNVYIQTERSILFSSASTSGKQHLATTKFELTSILSIIWQGNAALYAYTVGWKEASRNRFLAPTEQVKIAALAHLLGSRWQPPRHSGQVAAQINHDAKSCARKIAPTDRRQAATAATASALLDFLLVLCFAQLQGRPAAARRRAVVQRGGDEGEEQRLRGSSEMSSSCADRARRQAGGAVERQEQRRRGSSEGEARVSCGGGRGDRRATRRSASFHGFGGMTA